jgi:kynurenine formamidase
MRTSSKVNAPGTAGDPVTNGLRELSDLLRSRTFVDLSPTIENGMPRWITHPPLVINPTMNHDHDDYYCQTVFFAEHTGSHIDAPAHVHPNMMHWTIDTVRVNTFFAPAALFDLRPYGLQPGNLATAAMLQEIDSNGTTTLGPGDVALLNFGWWERYWVSDKRWRFYSENSPGLSEDATLWLADRQPVAVGADTVGVDIALRAGVQVQKAYGHDENFLPRGIFIIECLANLNALPQRSFFIALPLKIAKGSGSPVRAVAVV